MESGGAPSDCRERKENKKFERGKKNPPKIREASGPSEKMRGDWRAGRKGEGYVIRDWNPMFC